MGEGPPELDGKSSAEKAQALYQEALDTLDLALKAQGSERILLLSKALELRRWAWEFADPSKDTP